MFPFYPEVYSFFEQAKSSEKSAFEKVLLIDDDPIYCRLMQKMAEKQKMNLTACQSTNDLSVLESKDKLADYSAIIVDYDFGLANGVEIAEYLVAKNHAMQFILISSSSLSQLRHSNLPVSIKAIMQKNVGAHHILQAAKLML